MKKIFFSLLIIPFASIGGFSNSSLHYNSKPIEIRSGEWPIILEESPDRAGAVYTLQFRDMQVMTSSVMDTLVFPNLSQLKYFETALTTLKSGNTGDMARFKDYSIARTDKKNDGTWYTLKLKYTLTDFKQSEADFMVKTIRGLKF